MINNDNTNDNDDIHNNDDDDHTNNNINNDNHNNSHNNDNTNNTHNHNNGDSNDNDNDDIDGNAGGDGSHIGEEATSPRSNVKRRGRAITKTGKYLGIMLYTLSDLYFQTYSLLFLFHPNFHLSLLVQFLPYITEVNFTSTTYVSQKHKASITFQLHMHLFSLFQVNL